MREVAAVVAHVVSRRQRQLPRALRVQRRLAAVALFSAFASSALSAVGVHAATQGAQLSVGAIVLARAELQVEYQHPSLTVSPTDIARGYVDVPLGTRLRVCSNSPSGYMINVLARLPIFKSVDVSARSTRATIGPDGGTIVERGRLGKQLLTELAYRFVLADDVAPGVYPWPLALEVRPL